MGSVDTRIEGNRRSCNATYQRIAGIKIGRCEMESCWWWGRVSREEYW